MSNYGRQGSFLQTPLPHDRLGRYIVGDDPILMFAPAIVPSGAVVDVNGRLPLELATGAQAPRKTRSGIVIWESPWGADRLGGPGLDPVLTRASDVDTAPANTAAQFISGTQVRLRLNNRAEFSFDGQRTYAARTMVAGLGGATPTVEEGELLTPGVGTDADGYWAVTATAANAWLVVTAVNNDTGELDAQFLF